LKFRKKKLGRINLFKNFGRRNGVETNIHATNDDAQRSYAEVGMLKKYTKFENLCKSQSFFLYQTK